jgi:hypothetical protein
VQLRDGGGERNKVLWINKQEVGGGVEHSGGFLGPGSLC